MKVISLYEGKDVETSGVIGTVKSVGITKQLKRFVLKSDSKHKNDIPSVTFSLLLYKMDTFSDVLTGVERYNECELIRHFDSTVFEIAFKDQEFFNTDEMGKIRANRISLFLQDDDDEDSDD